MKQMMKTIFKKTFCIAVLSVLLAVLMAFQNPVTRVSAAGDPYISELQVVAAKDYKEALGKAGAGFKVLETPLVTPNPEDKDTKLSTFLCYKTTDKKEDAIYDIKTMEMGGGYSYSKYASYLEDQKDLSEDYVKSLAPAIKEFQDNKRKNKELTKTIYEILDCFVEDDSGKSVAQLFTEAQFDKKGKLTDESVDMLSTMFMQGNIEIIMVVEQLLLVSFNDTTDSSWLEFLNDYTETMCRHGEEFVISDEMDYKDEVKIFKGQVGDVRDDIKYFLNQEKTHPFTAEIEAEQAAQDEIFWERCDPEATEEENAQLRAEIRTERWSADPNGVGGKYSEFCRWFEGLYPDEQLKWIHGHTFYNDLRSTQYPLNKYDSLYDLIMVADPEELDKEDYYPLMYALTPGQRSLLLLGSTELLLTAMTDADTYIEQFSEYQIEGEAFSKEEKYSVYDGVDRSLYDPDGIAMTEHALEYARYSGESPFEKKHVSAKTNNALKISTIVVGGLAGLGVLVSLIGTMGYCASLVATGAVGGFSTAVSEWFSSALFTNFSAGNIILAVTIALIIIFLIVLAVYLIYSHGYKDYEPIPRVLCSAEDQVYKGINSEGKMVTGEGYVYYYGVKNPNQPATVYDSDAGKEVDTSNQVMDIYNWSLAGSSRRWVALYTSKDQRLCYMDESGEIHRMNPIKVDSLKVSTKQESGVSPVTNFNNVVTNLMYWYQNSHNTLKDTENRYLFKIHYTDKEFKNLPASVFADNAELAFGGGGLVLGALGGTFITLAAKKKKKEVPVDEQA
ncbi:MAG: MgtC/SapB family protein [Clostridiales bacterium]|nr:MgtC/SapB family protein [Candidatus Coliplasma caballi]